MSFEIRMGVLLATALLPTGGAHAVQIDTLRHGRFGPVVVYRREPHPSQVVLLVSGDAGWNHEVVRMAKELAAMDALVVGIDIRRYLGALPAAKRRYSYPAGDFESLSQWIQQKLGYPSYVSPILVGYSSGAGLIYATLAQSPPGTFRGGLSLGGFCRGSRTPPPDSLPAPWILLHGDIDSSCPSGRAVVFAGRIRNARIVLLPRVGHGSGVESRWMPQFRQAFAQLAASSGEPDVSPAAAVQDLPLVELPSIRSHGMLAVVISGDGGWAGIDRQIGETFASQGIPVVGLNSLKYLWKGRTPDQAGADLTRILRHYLKAWNESRILLVGYSRGADVLPFMASRLAPDLRGRVELVALLGLSHEAGFEFHFADLLGGGSNGRPTVPEIRRLRGMRLLCVYGTDEDDTACRGLPPDLATVLEVPGGHHFGGAYQDLAHRIVQIAAGP